MSQAPFVSSWTLFAKSKASQIVDVFFLPRETVQYSTVLLVILFPGLEEWGAEGHSLAPPSSSVGLPARPFFALLGMAHNPALKRSQESMGAQVEPG